MIQIVLLRGINLGAHKRVAMAQLRELLTHAGLDDVRTYLQSGNVVLSSDERPDDLGAICKRAITNELGLDVTVLVRTRDELAEVIRRDPLGSVAREPKRYQVTFLSAELEPSMTERLEELASKTERVVAIGREVYAWHPSGVARSKLWSELAADGRLGVSATSRNWSTVTNLLEMADD